MDGSERYGATLQGGDHKRCARDRPSRVDRRRFSAAHPACRPSEHGSHTDEDCTRHVAPVMRSPCPSRESRWRERHAARCRDARLAMKRDRAGALTSARPRPQRCAELKARAVQDAYRRRSVVSGDRRKTGHVREALARHLADHRPVDDAGGSEARLAGVHSGRGGDHRRHDRRDESKRLHSEDYNREGWKVPRLHREFSLRIFPWPGRPRRRGGTRRASLTNWDVERGGARVHSPAWTAKEQSPLRQGRPRRLVHGWERREASRDRPSYRNRRSAIAAGRAGRSPRLSDCRSSTA
jgi:hypothetical protein